MVVYLEVSQEVLPYLIQVAVLLWQVDFGWVDFCEIYFPVTMKKCNVLQDISI